MQRNRNINITAVKIIYIVIDKLKSAVSEFFCKSVAVFYNVGFKSIPKISTSAPSLWVR